MHDYKEQLPEGCPPSDAAEIEQVVFYRMVASFPPTDNDFLSHKALNPMKNFNKECIARGVSVFVGIRGITDVSKLPTQQGKQIARLNLTAPAGRHKQTGAKNDHHSWWVYEEFDLATHCRSELVSEF